MNSTGSGQSGHTRRPSPDSAVREEATFQSKLDEIKRLRQTGQLGRRAPITGEKVDGEGEIMTHQTPPPRPA